MPAYTAKANPGIWPKLEVIGFNIESCVLAEAAGADRIELCDNPAEGGTTPSYGFIKAARKKLQIELYPIIRPRGGDFLYGSDEFEIMKTDIIACKQSGCDGVVFGLLNADGTIDKDRCRMLVELAYPLGVTFHRAFDRVKDPVSALEEVIDAGCERILSSGLSPTALEGAALLASLIKQADNRISIMPGSGIRFGNIIELAGITGATEFHSSARKYVKSKMKYISKNMKELSEAVMVDESEVRKIIEKLRPGQ